MSGGILPRYTVTARQRPQVSVAAQGRPQVASVAVRGQQGVQGPQGVPGPTGAPGRYGQIRWADTHVDPEDYFSANVRQQLKFLPDPLQTQNFLRDPFIGVDWVDNRIIARANAYGDWQDIIVNLLVVPQFAGGSIVADIDVGTGAPVQTSVYSLRGSGVAERATFPLSTQALNGFIANGAKVFLTGTVPFVVQSESIVYVPISAGPGQP